MKHSGQEKTHEDNRDQVETLRNQGIGPGRRHKREQQVSRNERRVSK